MRLAARRLALACALLGLAAAPARAQDQLEAFLGQPVSDVRIELEGELSLSPGLRQLITVVVGQPLRQQDLRATQNALVALNTFDDDRMEVVAAKSAGGVVVTFRLWNRHPVDRFDLTGDTGLDPATLRDRVLDQFGRVLPTTLTPDRMRGTIERVLRDEGYLRATVQTIDLIQIHDRHRATMQVSVAAGPRAMITGTTVTGRSPHTPDEIIDRTATSPGLPFRERDIRERLAQVRDELGRRGYYSATARIEARRESADGAGIALTLAVNAGPRVQILWDRSADPPPNGLDDHVPVRLEGSVDQDLLDQGETNLEAALRRQGYLKADVTHSRNTDGDLLTITYRIVRGRRHYIDHVQLPDQLRLPRPLVEKLLGIKPGEVLDDRRITEGLLRVLAEYEQRGYYRVDAKPQYEDLTSRQTDTQAWVVFHPTFIEGPLGVVANIEFVYAGGPGKVTQAELLAAMRSRRGQPYLDANRLADEEALRSLYDARGYRDARVEIAGPDDKAGEQITLRVLVNEGLPSVVGDILVFGNTIDEQSILEDMTLRPGDPFSEQARLESERKLYDRGVFRRVRVMPEPALPGETRVRVIVTVEELPATTTGYGGGVEVGTIARTTPEGRDDDLFAAPRGFFQISRRNLGGRNRLLSFYSRLSLKPSERTDRRFGFTEYRIAGTFQEIRAFQTEVDVLLGVSSEQARRTGYNFVRHGMSADLLRRLTPSLALTGRYALDFTRLFDVNPATAGPIDRTFPQVRLSTVATGLILDKRDNPLAATRGSLVTVDFEVAARALGSEVGYAKTFAQISRFFQVGGDFVVASRAQMGVARGFEREVERTDPFGNPVVDVVADLPASQRFFAGGSTTVRGYQLDMLGVEELIDPVSGLSRGGNGVVVMNLELRRVLGRVVGRPVAGVAFIDAGNVFAKASDIDLARLQATPGFGVRFDSPLGPIRFDMGFKLSRRVIGGTRERGFEFHLSIGEAF